MVYKQKLINLLCTIDKIKQDMEWYYWNNLDYHHLMIYCEKKRYAFAIWSTWKLIWNRNEEWSYVEIQLDNTKPFSNQSEEVYEQIFNYLNK